MPWRSSSGCGPPAVGSVVSTSRSSRHCLLEASDEFNDERRYNPTVRGELGGHGHVDR